MKSIKIKYHILFLLPILIFTIACKNKLNQEVKIYAAAGTMQPVSEISKNLENTNNTNTLLNFAASGALARQINTGAEADIFISANKQWIDYLSEKKLIRKETIAEIAHNRLVIITNVNNNDITINFTNNFDIKSIIKDKISIGDPQYVPVGKYAKQALDSLNWYDKIQNNIILAKDVNSVLHYVELNECDWGIVYQSEAIKSNKVKIITEIPPSLHSPIVFYITTLNAYDKTLDTYNYFLSEQSIEIFNKFGFTTN